MNPSNEQAATVLEHRAAQEKAQHSHRSKIGMILAELQAGRSLNRFEAEKVGDHCLHSTVAALRAEGYNIISRWEDVPTRFGRTARVKRYSYAGGPL
jgi:hypothetical protein